MSTTTSRDIRSLIDNPSNEYEIPQAVQLRPGKNEGHAQPSSKVRRPRNGVTFIFAQSSNFLSTGNSMPIREVMYPAQDAVQ